MEFEKIAVEAIVLIVGAIGASAVVKSQLQDVREGVAAHSRQLAEQALKVERLETQHEDSSRRLEEALRKLEDVTRKLQEIALDIARSATRN